MSTLQDLGRAIVRTEIEVEAAEKRATQARNELESARERLAGFSIGVTDALQSIASCGSAPELPMALVYEDQVLIIRGVFDNAQDTRPRGPDVPPEDSPPQRANFLTSCSFEHIPIRKSAEEKEE